MRYIQQNHTHITLCSKIMQCETIGSKILNYAKLGKFVQK